MLTGHDHRLAHAEHAAAESGAGLAELGAWVQALEQRQSQSRRPSSVIAPAAVPRVYQAHAKESDVVIDLSLSFQNTCILKIIYKSFISMELSLLLRNSHHLFFHQYYVTLAYLTCIKLL